MVDTQLSSFTASDGQLIYFSRDITITLEDECTCFLHPKWEGHQIKFSGDLEIKCATNGDLNNYIWANENTLTVVRRKGNVILAFTLKTPFDYVGA